MTPKPLHTLLPFALSAAEGNLGGPPSAVNPLLTG